MNNNEHEEQLNAEEPSIKDQIISFLRKGYKRRQLIEDFGFNSNSVDKAVKTWKEKFGGETIAEESPEKHELLKIGAKESIAPESVVDALIFPKDGQDGIQTWKSGYLSALTQVFGIARLLQILNSGQAETITNQLKIYEAASGGTEKAIKELASVFVGINEDGRKQIIEVLQTQGQQQRMAASGNPMQVMLNETLAQTFQPMLAGVLGRIMGNLGGLGQPPPQGQTHQPPGQASAQDQSQWENVRERPINEWENETSGDNNPMVEHHSISELEED